MATVTRRVLFVVTLFAAALGICACNSASETPSYKSGYSLGVSGKYADSEADAISACDYLATHPGSLRSNINRTQWNQGCHDGVHSVFAKSTREATAPPRTTVFPTTTSTAPPTTNAPLTPLQKFESDAVNQIADVKAAVMGAGLSYQEVGDDGKDVCRKITLDATENSTGQTEYNNLTGGASPSIAGQGLNLDYGFTGTNADLKVFVSLAIEDLCPTYLSDIPAAEPRS
jgi:hypothetical protein